ncbi:MAG: hypothetical protein INQ03_18390 [Candidatus Heimdallarchaeota archaeon]|nr:hypothetical protein [Candidatus Heimdallarchaeota archaeon]
MKDSPSDFTNNGFNERPKYKRKAEKKFSGTGAPSKKVDPKRIEGKKKRDKGKPKRY